ncbi:MAG: fibro-slime domain-containing protein [Planctomycetota bacterium]
MNSKASLTTAALLAAMAAPTALTADTIELTGIVRDFKVSHPDMQNPDKDFGVKQGLVAEQLGVDGVPVLSEDHYTGRGMINDAESFAQWYRDTPGVNISIPYTVVLDNEQEGPGGVYSVAIEKPNYFFPIDGQGWGDTETDANGNDRNFYFTYELATEFTYTDPETRDLNGNGETGEDADALVFKFTGDDDVWVFVNGQLVVDIGGVHGQASDEVNIDDIAEELGLDVGENYELRFFFAERHTTESNFRIETTLSLVETEPTTVSPLYD